MSDFDEQLRQALEASKVLQPLLVEVRNDSLWYYMRNRLGPRRQLFQQVKFNEAQQHFEAYIYQLLRRDDDLRVVPKKSLVGHAPDKLRAFKLCEKARRERDSNRERIWQDMFERGLRPNFQSHFSVKVVSSAFEGLSPTDRYGLVYDELLRSLGGGPARPIRFKGVSVMGANVKSLYIFRHLPNPDPVPSSVTLPPPPVLPAELSASPAEAPPASLLLGETRLLLSAL
eukprot:gene41995-51266_t